MSENDKIEIRSLCKFYVNNNGVKKLERLGDIDDRGKIKYPSDPRNKIFWNDGPQEKDFVGIWSWSVIPSNGNPDNDYIDSYYDYINSPIEIIEISNAESIDDLVKCLKDGVYKIPVCERVMFAHKLSPDKYEAVLCERKMLEINNEHSKLKSDVTSLNVYYFGDREIFKTNKKNFYVYINPGKADHCILTKPRFEIIKEIILERASWKAAKQNNISKNEWRSLKDFIKNLSDESVYQKIAYLFNCNEEEAKNHIDDFIVCAANKIEVGDIDDSVLHQIIVNNVDLYQECERLVEQEWEKNNQEKIKKSVTELEKINKELAEQLNKKNAIDSEIESKEKELEKIIKDISEHKTICNSVKAKVQKKIEEARKDVAEFISQITMFSSVSTTIMPGEQNDNFNEIYIPGSDCHNGEIISYHDALNSIEDELGESGIEAKYITSLAAYIYSAYLNNTHLLLAGPNGESITNALSIGLFGKYAGVLDCNQKYSRQVITKVLSGNDQIVIVKNPFNSEWVNEILSLLAGNRKFFILLNSFTEDLLIEPKGLFNYVLPLFTETIVNDYPRNNFIGKTQSADFKDYKHCNPKPLYGDFLKTINVGGLLKNKIQRVLTDLHNLDKHADNTVDYMYIFFSYSYLTGQSEVFAEKINKDRNVENDKKEYMLKYLGERQ